MNKHALVRGSLLIFIILGFSILFFERSQSRAAAADGISADYAHYLPLILSADCLPGPIIESDNLDKDLAVEAGINDIRVDHGLTILTNSHKLTQAALRHSHDLADNNLNIGHTGSDGSTPGQRLDGACYQWLALGEIVAGGYGGKPGRVIEAWMGSPGHRDAILFDLFTEFGAGYAYKSRTTYKHYFTVDFGLPDTSFNTAPRDYYSCEYFVEDETGQSWLNLYSIWPCDQVLNSTIGVDSHD